MRELCHYILDLACHGNHGYELVDIRIDPWITKAFKARTSLHIQFSEEQEPLDIICLSWFELFVVPVGGKDHHTLK